MYVLDSECGMCYDKINNCDYTSNINITLERNIQFFNSLKCKRNTSKRLLRMPNQKIISNKNWFRFKTQWKWLLNEARKRNEYCGGEKKALKYVQSTTTPSETNFIESILLVAIITKYFGLCIVIDGYDFLSGWH